MKKLFLFLSLVLFFVLTFSGFVFADDYHSSGYFDQSGITGVFFQLGSGSKLVGHPSHDRYGSVQFSHVAQPVALGEMFTLGFTSDYPPYGFLTSGRYDLNFIFEFEVSNNVASYMNINYQLLLTINEVQQIFDGTLSKSRSGNVIILSFDIDNLWIQDTMPSYLSAVAIRFSPPVSTSSTTYTLILKNSSWSLYYVDGTGSIVSSPPMAEKPPTYDANISIIDNNASLDEQAARDAQNIFNSNAQSLFLSGSGFIQTLKNGFFAFTRTFDIMLVENDFLNGLLYVALTFGICGAIFGLFISTINFARSNSHSDTPKMDSGQSKWDSKHERWKFK